MSYFFYQLVLKDEFLLRYKLFLGTYPTVLKRIVCCNGNHAFSHSSNGFIFSAILLPIEGGSTKQFDAHEKLSRGRKAGLIRPLGSKEFKCFYF